MLKIRHAATEVLEVKGSAVTPLTQGGQKVVLRAILAHREVVVKVVLLPNGPTAAIVLERARREVDLLASIHSNYVVKVVSESIEIGTQPDAVAWAEEYLDG